MRSTLLPKSLAGLVIVVGFALPIPASAQEALACSDGYVAVASVGGPLCVNPVYLDGTWQDDPATCTHGYYQGSCVPDEYADRPPVVFEPLAYQYQPITPVVPAKITFVEMLSAFFRTFES